MDTFGRNADRIRRDLRVAHNIDFLPSSHKRLNELADRHNESEVNDVSAQAMRDFRHHHNSPLELQPHQHAAYETYHRQKAEKTRESDPARSAIHTELANMHREISRHVVEIPNSTIRTSTSEASEEATRELSNSSSARAHEALNNLFPGHPAPDHMNVEQHNARIQFHEINANPFTSNLDGASRQGAARMAQLHTRLRDSIEEQNARRASGHPSV
jgi:hypothetical protein